MRSLQRRARQGSACDDLHSGSAVFASPSPCAQGTAQQRVGTDKAGWCARYAGSRWSPALPLNAVLYRPRRSHRYGNESMTVEQAIQKAALLLDLKNDAKGAEAVLSEALQGILSPSPSVFRAQVMLATVVSSVRPLEARQHLAEALGSYCVEWDDVVQQELNDARALLERIS